MTMRLVLLESPYHGEPGSGFEDLESNVAYARAAMLDCLMRDEAPLASHLLYTQPGVLNDADPEQRAIGILAGLAWGSVANITAVYMDRGISPGMKQGIARAAAEGRRVIYRSLPDWRNVSGGWSGESTPLR